MNVFIENYRGFEIIFNNESERFSFTLDNGSWNEKQSYAACKKNIDDFVKDNQSFTPFMVRHKMGGNTMKIVGLRKDGRFATEVNGKKEQMSDYEVRDYITVDAADEIVFANVASMEADIENLRQEIEQEYLKLKGKRLDVILKELIKK